MPQAQYPTVLAGQDLTAGTIQAFAAFEAWKSSDTSRASTTTPTADPDLTFAVVASATYKLEGLLIFTGDTTGSGGFEMEFTAPTGASLTWTQFSYSSAVSASGLAISAVVGTGTTRTAVTDGATALPMFVKGTLINGGNAGTLALLWCQQASDATATVLKTGSRLTLTRLA